MEVIMPYATLSRSTTDGRLAVGDAHDRLAARQIAILVAFGLAFWLVAALFIRFAPFDVFNRGLSLMLLFATTAPVAWLSVQIAKLIARLTPGQLLPGVAVASASAMLCDGIGLIWWSIYGGADRLPGAAWLLWGVGLILFAAFFDGRRRGA
jgi:hypothetical protein